MNAFSFTFPPGERYFMSAVKAMREQVTDPVLLAQVRGFLAQEGMHSREHSTFNEWLDRLGYPATQIAEEIGLDLDRRKARRSPHFNLAITCALEHFTAIMAESWLSQPHLRAQAHENVRDLWTWHALEELDHKAVAFDVYKAAGGTYKDRVSAMAIITFGLIASISLIQLHLMARDGQLRNVKSWLSGLREFWGPRGHFTRLIPSYLSYYRPDFHPYDHDESELIERFEQQLRSRWEKPASRAQASEAE